MTQSEDEFIGGSLGDTDDTVKDPAKLMQQLQVSALFLALIYAIVVFIVWRGVQRVFREMEKWNSLKIFCSALLLVPILRTIAFLAHFGIYEGEEVDIQTPNFIHDVVMNGLYMIPSFISIFSYMLLICLWIEMTMFSRDQPFIAHARYNRIWKSIYLTVTVLVFLALIGVLIYAAVTEGLGLLNALYEALWIMTFVVPVFAFVVWVVLIIRFAGFPYLNDVWKQQGKRMFLVVIVWTFGQIIIGVMTAIWSANTGKWISENNYLWFALSVAVTLCIGEIGPLIYTSDWSRIGFLLLAFVNWRDLWVQNQEHARQHDPRLIDDPFHNRSSHNNNHPEMESKRSLTPSNISVNNISTPLLNLHNSSSNALILEDPRGSKKRTVLFENADLNLSDLEIDTSFSYSNDNNPYYQTHRGTCSGVSVCVRVFSCANVEQSMLTMIVSNLNKFKTLKHENLGHVFGAKVIASDGNECTLRIVSLWNNIGSLYDIINKSPKDTPFANHVIRRMILQICCFMKWLHTVIGIPHGYLKTSNILFDDEMNVCVTDVGLISLKKTLSICDGNLSFDGYWMDKEYFDGKSVDFKCDVWAFGFVLYEIITKCRPFQFDDLSHITKCILRNENMPKLPKHCPPFLVKLVNQCWTVNREERPTFDEIIQEIQTNM